MASVNADRQPTHADCAFAVPTLCASVLLDLLRATGSAAPAPGDGFRWALAGGSTVDAAGPATADGAAVRSGDAAEGDAAADSDTEAPVDEALDAANALESISADCAHACRERLARGIWGALQRGGGTAITTVLHRRLQAALAGIVAGASGADISVPLALAVDATCALARLKPPPVAPAAVAAGAPTPAAAAAPTPPALISIAELRRAREQQQRQEAGGATPSAAVTSGAALAAFDASGAGGAGAAGAVSPLPEDPARLRPSDAKRLARDMAHCFMKLLDHVPPECPPRRDWRRAALAALVRQQRRESTWAEVLCPQAPCAAAAAATASPKPHDGWARVADAAAPASTRAALELVERALFASLQAQHRTDAALIAHRRALTHAVCGPLAAAAGSLPLAELVILCDARAVERALQRGPAVSAPLRASPRWVALCVLPMGLDGAVTLPPPAGFTGAGAGHCADGLLWELERLAQASAATCQPPTDVDRVGQETPVTAPSAVGMPNPVPWSVPRGVVGTSLAEQTNILNERRPPVRALLTLDGPFAAWASAHA